MENGWGEDADSMIFGILDEGGAGVEPHGLVVE